ncbi:MAG: Crp/Fnr family transcriptional regulator [Thermodesulfovibrionales bacterium]|nr:Crp/Fnr family transcriptional regulator [Thermodesulfovibrionales bacterium]
MVTNFKNNKTISNITLFKGLSDDNLTILSGICQIKRVDKGNTIFLEGQDAHGFYCINTGLVKIYKIGFDGKEQILHILGEGEIFGEVPVFIGGTYPANALSLQDSILLFFPKDDFISIIKGQPQIALNMIAALSVRLKKFALLVENLSLKEVPSRLANYILYLKVEQDMTNVVTLDVSKTQLASILGTIPETLSRILSKMSSKGLIDVKGKVITILNQKELEELASGIDLLK